VLLDKMGKTLPNGMAISSISSVLAIVLSMVAFGVITNKIAFFVVSAIRLTALNVVGAPLRTSFLSWTNLAQFPIRTI
jgi:hypothetical protein